MTVRTTELLVAVILGLCAVAVMVKSTDGLNIGWVPGTGPGSGMWPFVLSVGMLLATLTTIVQWFLKATPESRSDEPFMTAETLRIVGVTVVALAALLIASHVIGMYLAIALFLFFYLRVLGKHGWALTATLAIAAPVGLFLFFDWALLVPLPKAYSEPLFLPLYDFIY